MIKRVDALLFCSLLCTFAYFYQGGFSNQNTRLDLAMAIAFEHRMAIDTFASNTLDKASFNGHYYLEKAPGASYLALPVTLVAARIWTIDQVLSNPVRGDLILYVATLFTVSFWSALAAVAFRRTLALLNDHLSVATTFGITLLVFLGTLALPYSTMLFGHQLAASFLIIGNYFLLSAYRLSVARSPTSRVFVGMLALSMLPLLEYPSTMLAAAIFGAHFWAAPSLRRSLWKGLAVGILPAALLAFHNWASFGSVLAVGYGKLQETPFSAEMQKGIGGITLPSLTVLGQLTFGTYRGLFIYSPLLLFGCAGLYFWPRSDARYAKLLFVGVAAVLLMISGYVYWQGGTCFGPRHLVPIVPFVAFGLAYLPQSWFRSVPFVVCAAISIAISWVGTVISPLVTEFYLSPLRQVYWPLLVRGEVSTHALGFLTPFSETGFRSTHYRLYADVSKNLGELAGLPGWWSVTPLLLFWAAALLLFRKLNRGAGA